MRFVESKPLIYDLSLLLALVFETCAKTAKGLERRSPRGGCCSKTCTFFRKCFTKKHKSEKSDVRRWLAGVALALEIFLAQVEATFVERRASLYFFQVFLCDRHLIYCVCFGTVLAFIVAGTPLCDFALRCSTVQD